MINVVVKDHQAISRAENKELKQRQKKLEQQYLNREITKKQMKMELEKPITTNVNMSINLN